MSQMELMHVSISGRFKVIALEGQLLDLSAETIANHAKVDDDFDKGEYTLVQATEHDLPIGHTHCVKLIYQLI